ncbi:MAG: dUTPase [Candidatus Nitrosocosmicus sp.]
MSESIEKNKKDVSYHDEENNASPSSSPVDDNTPLNIINYSVDEKKIDDKLDFLFNKQNELFKKQMENTENKMKNLYEIKEPFDGYRLFMLSTALVHEAIELQRETNWKWWKKEIKTNDEKIQEEIIDIWHFLIQLSIEAGLDSKKLIEKYMQKNEENLKRQVKGY